MRACAYVVCVCHLWGSASTPLSAARGRKYPECSTTGSNDTGLPHVTHEQLPCELQVDVAALRLRDSILTSAETEGLTYQAYWLSTTLALGAFLKVCPPHCVTSWLCFSVRDV